VYKIQAYVVTVSARTYRREASRQYGYTPTLRYEPKTLLLI